ncbi:DUF2971 domain-containing protein [Erythrobacter sp. T5W1-R]|uniref:DUF2971 domain-containing protein n=1 Tax=Erythrobacter sp. T5W1-R TaxID=3101752 RepID=UPI002AFDF08F|nr:DUF2971 domain-containing protein [Erythrobacter sp. T5W1-R]MEA1617590.1 DUF2971 domain-containing protein [Erythrobacter sp. T5W1-R]
MSTSATLRRYTNALSLLDILRHQRLTLLNPSRWYDQNDALGLKSYGRHFDNMSVFAACFAEGAEQAHHWQIFAGDAHGVAIIFNKDRLLQIFDALKDFYEIRHGPVLYCNLKQLRDRSPIPIEQLPFLKRETFKAEEEYRVVALDNAIFGTELMHIPIRLDCIERVVLGPGMPDSLAKSLREISIDLEGCSEMNFSKSRLVNNESWAEALSEALGKEAREKLA